VLLISNKHCNGALLVDSRTSKKEIRTKKNVNNEKYIKNIKTLKHKPICLASPADTRLERERERERDHGDIGSQQRFVPAWELALQTVTSRGTQPATRAF
jgi:hypothetical protein